MLIYPFRSYIYMTLVAKIAATYHRLWDCHLDVRGSDAEYSIILRIIMYRQQF